VILDFRFQPEADQPLFFEPEAHQPFFLAEAEPILDSSENGPSTQEDSLTLAPSTSLRTGLSQRERDGVKVFMVKGEPE